MAQESRTTIKTYFNTGDTPTEAQYHNLIDSAAWYDEISAGGAPSVKTFEFTPAGLFGVKPQGQIWYYGAEPTISWNEATGLFTFACPTGCNPVGVRLLGDQSATNSGTATIRVTTVDNLEVAGLARLKREDSSKRYVSNFEDYSVFISETVSEGQTDFQAQGLTNINNFSLLFKLFAW